MSLIRKHVAVLQAWACLALVLAITLQCVFAVYISAEIGLRVASTVHYCIPRVVLHPNKTLAYLLSGLVRRN